MTRRQRLNGFRPKLISIAVASCFVAGTAFANPTGPTVVHGSAAFEQAGNLLKITNSPNAIINWQSFSIGANEITRFIQQNQTSAVLNRVTGNAGVIDPSVILGALQSNGRVFLINPSGILFGAGAQVDVAGLVASSGNLSNVDFLANRLNFTGMQGAGSVVNEGNINTRSGGNVYLVGPAVTNSGIITSPKGEVILAAGNSVTLVDAGTPNLQVEINAPDNQAVNLGQIIVDSGRAGIYAGLIKQAGTIRADSAVAEGGRILLKATRSVTLENTSVLSAQGQGGGEIKVLAGETVHVAGLLDASAPVNGDGGFVETSAAKVTFDPSTYITTRAPSGRNGTWLLDPTDVAIDSALWATIDASLDVSNVLITTFGSACSPGLCGSITISANSPDLATANLLQLVAHQNIIVDGSVTNSGTGTLAMYAGWNEASGSSNPTVGFSGDIHLNAPINIAGTAVLIGGGTIDQTATGAITASKLLANAGSGFGSVLLDSAINSVGTLAGHTYGTFQFTNGPSLVVGSVDSGNTNFGTIAGVQSTGSNTVAISVMAGDLTVNNNILADGGNSANASVTLFGSNNLFVNSSIIRAHGDPGEGDGNATVAMTAQTGDITLNNSSVEAISGPVGCCNQSRNATVTMNAGGNIALNASNLTVTGGSGGSGSAIGAAFASLSAGAAVTLDSGSTITVAGGQGGNAFTSISAAVAAGGAATLYINGGNVTLDGDIAVTGGAGGTANAPGATADAGGGGAYVSINAGGALSVGGNITAAGGIGGTATGTTAAAGGGYGQVNLQANGITVNGNVAAAGGAGGSANSAAGFGGGGFISLRTYGPITVAGNLTATGGDGGSGGSASIYVSTPFAGCEVSCPPPPPTGDVLITGALSATGGNGTSTGGSANVVIGYSSGITVNGGTITATGGNSGSSTDGFAKVTINSIGSITVGGDITTAGNGGSSSSNRGGIFLNAGDTIVSTGGKLGATGTAPNGNDPKIELTAVNGIGTQVNPILIQDGNMDISMMNTGTTLGDVSLSFVAGSVLVDGDFNNFFNNNPTGTYYVRVENGNFDLQIPFTPNGLPLLGGQSVSISAPAGNVTIAQGQQLAGDIVTGTGTITLQASGTITTDVGTQLTGSVVNVSGVSIVSAGNVNGGAITATGTTGINIMGGVISGDSVTLAAPTITSAGTLSGVTVIAATATGALDITGGSFTAPAINLQGSSVTSNGALTGGPVNATANGGNVSLSQSPSIVLGQLSGAGVTVVSSGGAIVDGNAGVNVVATSAGLVAAAGIGSFADPLETQVGTLGLSSGSGEIGIINTGNLVLSGLTLTGPGVAAIGSSGTLTVAGLASSGGDLLLTANGNLTVNQNVSAVGTAELDSLANIDIKPTSGAVTVSGTTVLVIAGGNVNVGDAAASQPTNVTASDLVSISAGGSFAVRGGSATGASASVTGIGTGAGVATVGDVIVAGGSGGNTYAEVVGTNVVMSVGGTVQLTAGAGGGAYAIVESLSPTTIYIDFTNPSLTSGGYFVNGVEGAIYDSATSSGFVAGAQPAILDQNLIVTYGGIPLLPPAPPVTEPPSEIVEVINQVVAATNDQTDVQPIVTTTDPKEGEGEKEKKGLPTCK